MLSPKQIGTICLSFIFILISQSSFSDISADANSASCDNSTLNTYTGPAALEAKWNANEVQLRWYNNNTLMDVTASESSCEYDGNIDVATAPTRTGYDFAGWTVRPERSFDELKTASYTTGQKRWAKGEWLSDHSDYCYTGVNVDIVTNVSCNSDTNFFELQQYEWKVESNKGIIYGMAKCSNTPGEYAVAGNPSDEGDGNTKRYCWCQATGWVPNDEQTMYAPLFPLSWVFHSNDGSNCSIYCASNCSLNVRSSSGFLTALFTPVPTQ